MELLNLILIFDSHDKFLLGLAGTRKVHSELEAAVAVGFYF